jgi:hypothetical protein
VSDSTHIFRVALDRKRSVYRDIEIASTASLHDLAEAITGAFDFDFDHAFGFYSGKTQATLLQQQPKYELFADMGEADDAKSVKKTSVAEAFPKAGHSLTFLFDYGDEWRFHVAMTGAGTKAAKQRYPRLVGSKGEAPEQYPDPDEDDV